MSRSDAKKARRKKRQAARDSRWIPDNIHERVLDEIEIATELEEFADRLEDRGWVPSEDENDDRDSVIWLYPPSYDDSAPEGTVEATVVALLGEEEGEVAHVVFAGTDEHYEFHLDELFEHIEVIEAYRMGRQVPDFPVAPN